MARWTRSKGGSKRRQVQLTHDDRLKREGQLDQVVGKVKETAAKVAENSGEGGGYNEGRLTCNTRSLTGGKPHMITNNRFQQGMIRVLGSALLVLGAALVGVGCESEGPVERAGNKVDETVEEVKDKLNPDGPVEKAGKKVDQAVDKLKDK
jgi:uncharacterized protein YjbJ (UPF0337 family)